MAFTKLSLLMRSTQLIFLPEHLNENYQLNEKNGHKHNARLSHTRKDQLRRIIYAEFSSGWR